MSSVLSDHCEGEIPNMLVARVSVKLAIRTGWARNGLIVEMDSSVVDPKMAGTGSIPWSSSSFDIRSTSGLSGRNGSLMLSPSMAGLHGLRLRALPIQTAGLWMSCSSPALTRSSADLDCRQLNVS